MGQKALIRLLVIFAAIGAVALVVKFIDPGKVATVASSTDRDKVFDNFPIDDVAQIRVKTADAELNLKKTETAWTVAERDGYPANSKTIVDLLRKIWDLKISQSPEIGESQYGRLNLLDPAKGEKDKSATVLSFLNAGGQEVASLWLGKAAERKSSQPSPFGDGTTEVGRYVKSGGDAAVHLVSDTFREIDTDPAEWLNEDFFKIEKIKTIAIQTGTPEDDWKLTREDLVGDFSLADTKEGEELDNLKVGSMKAAFSSPRFEDVIVGDEAKEKAPGKTTFDIETFDGFTYTVKLGEKTDLNEYYLTFDVSGKFEETRKPGEEESAEEKTKLDEEFADQLKALKDQLAAEKAMAGKVYKVRSYVADSLIKKRSEILKTEEPKDNPEGATFTPGAEPGPGLPAGHPAIPGLPAGIVPAGAPQPADLNKPEPPKPADVPKPDAPKADAPKAGEDAPKPDAPKAGENAPKADDAPPAEN